MNKRSGFYTIIIFLMLLNFINHASVLDTTGLDEIRVQKLNMKLEPGSKIYSEKLFQGEIAETEINHIIIAGPFTHSESLSKEFDNIFIFIKGPGMLVAGGQNFKIEPESISLSYITENIKIQVSENDTLHYLNIQKKLTVQDMEDIKDFPATNRGKIYFMNFDSCIAYTEKIKSPNTISRTVLPKNYVPRVAMGTVQTIGPDEVGAHEHPMLDQLFLGLAGNDVIVYADDKSVHFPEFSILHIPIGSSHWVTVDEGKSMYYQWMDFFIDKEGEEWLKTHKPVNEYNKK